MLSCNCEDELYYKNNIHWYHGTNLASANNIINNGIDPLYYQKNVSQQRTLDFGPAFYLTSSKKQAVMWAHKKSAIMGSPAIVDINLGPYLKKINCKEFPYMSVEWAKFVLHCRLGEETHCSNKIIYGCMADGSIAIAIKDYKISKDFYTFWKNIYNEKYQADYDQLALVDPELCKKITRSNITIKEL